ncbi:hypothetical protein pipiens_014998 [Culex pipiens pipiens]|uniref:Uncharacterized protein n=1 Tax=Culex pipiens pipiens TaxID=38569 RepID=A0ABD1CS95_CULPP
MVRKAIVALFIDGEMNQILKDYKTPLVPLFSLRYGKVKFAENFSEFNKDPRLRKLFNLLKEDFAKIETDIATVSVERTNMEDFWTISSRNLVLPPVVDRATVKQFFDSLVIGSAQPSGQDLLAETNNEWRLWMLSWIKREDFELLTKHQLEQPCVSFKKAFEEWESVPKEPDPSSEQNELLNSPEYVGAHLDDRFTRFIRLGGQIHYIAKKTRVPRNAIVRAGPSQFQDQTSGQGSEFHAAHIIRVGDISAEIGESYCTFLKKFAGHTQIVPRYANLGIGQDIDKIQSQYLPKLLEVDFDELSEDDDAIIEEIRDEYLSALSKRINREEPESNTSIALSLAYEKIRAWSVDDLYEKVARNVARIREKCER